MNKLMTGKTFYHYASMRAAANGDPVMPISCEIDVSNVCNLNCSFCMFEDFRSRDRSLLDFVLFSSLVFQLRDVGCKSITFTGGGEPTIHPEFNDMAQLAMQAGFDIGLVTNGTMLKDVKTPQLFKFIRVSLDAGNPATYAALKGTDKFEKVLDGMRYAKDRGAFVGASFVVCRENVESMGEAEAVAKELDLEYIQFKPAYLKGSTGRSGIGYDEYEMPTAESDVSIIETTRSVAQNNLPCKMAGLVGIVTANAEVCFCCQWRGVHVAGNLHKTTTFRELWLKRHKLQPDITKCPPCRYMAYADAYEEFNSQGQCAMFWEHRDFL